MLSDSEKLEVGIANLAKLRDKLLNLKANSPKIKLSLRKDYTWDLWELADLSSNNNVSFPLNFIFESFKGEKTEEVVFDFSSLFKSLKNVEEKGKIKAKIKCLKRSVQRIYLEKGVNSFYLGLFFLRGYFFDYQEKEKLRLINAPLFFFPCNFQKNELGIIINKNKKVNYSLLYFFKRIFNLENNVFTKCLKNLEENDKGNLESLLFEVRQNLQELLQNHVSIKFSSSLNEEKTRTSKNISTHNNYNLESFVYLTLGNKPKEFKESELELSLNAILTIEREDNLSLFNDFEQIIAEYSANNLQNYPSSGLDLLTNKKNKDSTAKGSLLVNKNSEKKPLYLPFDSDPSQSLILKKVFYEFFGSALCVQGPPGTGKTQLICNLISNCLLYNKKVAVVCEKPVALEVICDRLTKIGIRPSVIKINDLGQTSNIYRDILGAGELIKKEKLSSQIYEKTITNLEEKQESHLTKLTNYHKAQKYFHDKHGILLGEVYIKRNEKINISSELIYLIKWVETKEQLEKLKENLEEYITKLKKIFQTQKELCLELKHLFLNSDLNLALDATLNQNYLSGMIDSLLWELKSEKNSKLISQILRISLVKEKSKNLSVVHLSREKNFELTSLWKRQDLKLLLTFLNIKTFGEFCQKCTNREFLLNLQEFISNNFSIIASLFSSINNFDENTQKSIKFLSKKIFLSHEFDYLDNYLEITEQAVYLNWLNSVEEKHRSILYNWNFQELVKIHEVR